MSGWVFVLAIACAEPASAPERREDPSPAQPSGAPEARSTPTPEPAAAAVDQPPALRAAHILGRDRDSVDAGRAIERTAGRWVFYRDGFAVLFVDGRAVRIRAIPCRLHSTGLPDLVAMGFEVSAARVVSVRDAVVVEGVPGVHIEGRARYCEIRAR